MGKRQYTDGMGRNPSEAAMAALDNAEQRPQLFQVAMTPIPAYVATRSMPVLACSEWEAADVAKREFDTGLSAETRLLMLDGDWVLLFPIGMGGGVAGVITVSREDEGLNNSATGAVGRV